MELMYDLVIHEEYGISLAVESATQVLSKIPKIENVAAIVSLALACDVQVMSSSGNASMEQVNLAAGASSAVSLFKLQSDLPAPDKRVAINQGKVVVSKHVLKGYVERESQRYDAFVKDLFFLSHPPLREHDNIVNVLGIGWEEGDWASRACAWPVLILEFAEYGTLEDYFRLEDSDKSWSAKKIICVDIATGLSWLHQCRIIHSDIKFGNILIFANSETEAPAPYRAKISDFGFALDLDALEGSDQTHALLEGYSLPCAPEAGSAIPLSLLTKVDIFSYGLLAGRVFLDGDEAFGQAPPAATEHLGDDFYESCAKSGLVDGHSVRLIGHLVSSTTSADPMSRVDMEEVLFILSDSVVQETSQHSTAAPLAVLDQLAAVPEVEEVWALGLLPTTRQTIVSGLLQLVQKYNKEECEGNDEDEQAVAAKAAYQLYLAHLIGFGCDQSEEAAIQHLRLSAQLGNPDAREETFAAVAALRIDSGPIDEEETRTWLTEAALRGDKSCLQELRTLDTHAYDLAISSTARRRTMCERSGFAFDDDFLQLNNVEDLDGLVSAILTSGEPIDQDIGGGMTWLHYAVFTSSLLFATQLVDDLGMPVDKQNDKGQTPLWISCLCGNYEISSFLLSRGADASIASNTRSNPLHHLPAFEDRHTVKIAQMLVEHGAKVNEQNTVGLVPLHYAVRGSGNLEEGLSVAVLLDLGANPLIPDDDGETALDFAIDTMRICDLERFLTTRSLMNLSNGRLTSILSNAFGNWIRQMKHHRIRCGSLHYAARIAQLIQLLHTDEILPVYVTNHPAGFTPLHDALAWSSDDLAAEFVKLPNTELNELDKGRYGYTPLMIAMRTCGREMVENLVQAGANPLVRAKTGENIIHHCVQYQPDLLSYMCDCIERQNGNVAMLCNQASYWKGETPLDYAIYQGRFEVARFLLSKGADPNIMRESPQNGGLGLNSLRCCLFPPNVSMFELLLPHIKLGSFVCVSDGRNLLHLACMHLYDEAKSGDRKIAPFINSVLEKFPAAINAPFGRNSETPLHFAASFGNVTAVKVLLQRDASPFLRNASGQTPLDEAIDISAEDGELIDKHGNKVFGMVRQRLYTRWRDTQCVLRRAMDRAAEQECSTA